IVPVILVKLTPLVLTVFPYTTLFRSHACDPGQPRQYRAVLFGRGGTVEVERVGNNAAHHDAGDLRRGCQAVAAEQVGHDGAGGRSEEHTSELQSREKLVCRLLLDNKK